VNTCRARPMGGLNSRRWPMRGGRPDERQQMSPEPAPVYRTRQELSVRGEGAGRGEKGGPAGPVKIDDPMG